MAHLYNSQLDAYALYHKQQEENAASTSVGPGLPALGHAIAGSTGTAISNLTMYPLDLIITRLQVQRQLRKSAGIRDEGEYEGVIDAATKIYNNEGGIAAFYSGVLQDTGKSIADSFLFFLFYNYLRQNRLQKHGASTTTLPVLDELGVGALAGACSKFFTTPLANIVTRKQTASMLSARSKSAYAEPSVREIAEQIRAEKGLQGFWSGYSASLVLTLNPSLTFFLYETFKRTLLPRSRRDDPGARLTFLMAAVSKAIASTITYPFSLAKARSQAGSKPPLNEQDVQSVKRDVNDVLKTEDSETIGEKKEQGRRARGDIKATAEKSTVFATILDIYRTEGPAALYEGVLGEICKGFFSHGTTMLVKEAVHKIIIQLYFFISKVLKRLPEKAGEVVNDAREKVGAMAESTNAAVGDAYEGAKGQAGDLIERAQVLGNNVTEVAKTGGDYAKSQAGNLLERAQTIGSNATEAASSGGDYAKAQTGDLAERAKTIGSNASEIASSGGDHAKSQVGSVLESAQENLGKTMEDLGKKLRSGSSEGESE